MTLKPYEVNRWKRYGHDRLYVSGPGGQRLGWLDLNTGEVVFEPGTDSAAARGALDTWISQNLRGHPATPLPSPSTPASAIETVTRLPDRSPLPVPPALQEKRERLQADDLATHEPGHLLIAQLQRAREREERLGKATATLARITGVHNSERAYREGLKGEQRIGAKLDKLEKRGWRVIHSIPVGAESDIDHLVIGPGGVYVVNSKRHKGAKIRFSKYGARVNGTLVDHHKQVRSQAKKAQAVLRPLVGEWLTVTGIVAVDNGGLNEPEFSHGGSPPGVYLVSYWNVATVLKREEPVLPPEHVRAIFEIARRASTWTS